MFEGTKNILTTTAKRHAAGRIDPDFSALAELYEMVRRRALGIDDKVKDVLNLLDKLEK
jgi:hypothetical protein